MLVSVISTSWETSSFCSSLLILQFPLISNPYGGARIETLLDEGLLGAPEEAVVADMKACLSAFNFSKAAASVGGGVACVLFCS